MLAADQAVVCPACASSSLRNFGPLPAFPPDLFGGISMQVGMSAGNLLRCPRCTLQFRHPCLSDSQLVDLYQALPDSIWDSDTARPYWPAALELLNTHAASRSLLDVGCFSGDMLNWFPGHWEKFGLEPSKSAAQLAGKRGIQVLGSTSADLGPLGKRFGAISSFDVIEHVADPMLFLRQLSQCLETGGCLLLLTGATDTFSYRLLGRRYWYGSFPEHVTFYSKAWFEWAAKELGLKLETHHYLSTEAPNFKLWWKQCAQSLLYATAQRLIEAGVAPNVLSMIPVLGRAVHWKSVPWWKQATDHIMVVLKK